MSYEGQEGTIMQATATINTGKRLGGARQPSAEQKRELAKKLESMRLKDREMVKGVFHYFEVPNGVLEFSYKKYAKDPVETYQLYDNHIYTLPLGVAKHLNTNVAYPEYEYIKGEDGKMMQGFNNMQAQGMKIRTKTRRCSFESLELIDMNEFEHANKKIIEVEAVILDEK